MTTFEKITSALIVVLIGIMVVFSLREVRESPGGDVSDFDQSLGRHFVIGQFVNVVSEHSSGGTEVDCEREQSVIIAVLHDIKEHLERLALITEGPGTFEVNQPTLDVLCNTQADITLSDFTGRELLLQKVPFTRGIPSGGGPDDIGTEVRINASVFQSGEKPPASPTTYSEVLIPDRYLEAATSSAD